MDIATSGAKINRLKVAIGEENLLNTMILLISDAVSFFNLPVERTMNANQVVFTAQALIEDYPTYSLEDFALCFKHGKKGIFGKNYSTFDGQILMSWIKIYDKERDEYFVNQNRIETPTELLTIKSEDKKVDMKKVYEEFKNRKEEIKPANKDEEYQKAKEQYFKQQILKQQENE